MIRQPMISRQQRDHLGIEELLSSWSRAGSLSQSAFRASNLSRID
jgi:hypothetical protein